METRLIFEKDTCGILVPFLLLACTPEKFTFSRVTLIVRNRACWEREFRDGRKRWQKKTREKGQKLHHDRSRLHGYFGFVNGERSFSLKTFSPPLFLPQSFSLARVDPRRQAKPHKGNIADRVSTASSPPPKYSPSPRFPHSSLPLFYLSSSVFFSSSLPLLLTTRKFTRPLRSDRLGTNPWTNPCSGVLRYLILLQFRDLICILQL